MRFGLLLRDTNLSSAPKTCRKWKNIPNQGNNIHSEVGIWQIWKVDDCQIQIYLKSDWHFETFSRLKVNQQNLVQNFFKSETLFTSYPKLNFIFKFWQSHNTFDGRYFVDNHCILTWKYGVPFCTQNNAILIGMITNLLTWECRWTCMFMLMIKAFRQ